MRGVAAIEFAMAMPLLMILLAGLLEIGFRMFESMQVQDAVEAGALYASLQVWNPDIFANSANLANTVTAVETATGTGGITATTSEICGCPSAGGIDQGGTCSGNPCSCAGNTCPAAGTAAGTYVQINSSLTHTSFITYPGLALPPTLTGYAIVRVN
jgi:Flp pilus assembly protein TadG